MTAYYNEIDPYAAQWLRNLISAGHIAPGDVDERSIVDVQTDDLAGYDQCHFFAGIGGWSVALRLAGWPDARPVWTGSCPCQPFSAAGAGKAADDKRHLWPAWLPLIAKCRPPVVFGEQVEAAVGWGWLDAVFTDLEGEGYACGATVLPACGIGAPHIRNRLWFVGSLDLAQCGGEPREARDERRQEQAAPRSREDEGRWVVQTIDPGSDPSIVGHTALDGGGSLNGQPGASARWQEPTGGSGISSRLANGHGAGLEVNGIESARHQRATIERGCAIGLVANAKSGGFREFGDASQPGRGGHSNGGFWTDAQWLPCTDGKARPVEPGTFPLAHGVQRRTSKLRAYGNAIVPQVAAEFIGATMNLPHTSALRKVQTEPK